ncbi:MAG: hypothetical protein IV100_30705 [Myxococcales bacterium]|nr:hypothetical protein [Myxococcales bacterium]
MDDSRREPPSPSNDAPERIEVQQRGAMGELWAYLRVRKKWWLAPMLVVILALGALAFFTQTSALAPFIYTLF